MGEMKNYKIVSENLPREVVEGKSLMRLIFKKWDVRLLTGFIWLKIGTSGWLM
jgi:hypothetical protein